MSAILAPNADAGAARGPAPTVSAGSRAAKAAGSLALFAAAGGKVQVAKGVTGSTPGAGPLLALGDGAVVATAVNPSGGDDGLVCTGSHTVFAVKALRTSARADGAGIDASSYTGEGGAHYGFSCRGVAVHGRFGLAAGHSQGLLQLARRNGHWKIDKRVQSPGHNDAGQPHRPGWIDIRDSTTHATRFNSVAIAPKPRPDGSFLAVAIDRADHALVVVKGVGAAQPRVKAALSARALHNTLTNTGNGGIAFLPASPDRAVIATKSGFAVLDLHRPAAPRLVVRTALPNTSARPASLTISSDRDHLAVAAGKWIYGYDHVHAAVTKGTHVQQQVVFRLGGNPSESVSDVAYTPNDTLVVPHGDPTTATSWLLTLVKLVPTGSHSAQGSLITTEPGTDGSLSLWPVP